VFNYFPTPGATEPIFTSEDKRDGVVVICLVQHTLLACSRKARKECLEGFYPHKRFTVAFDLSINKLKMSDLATTLELLLMRLMRAVFTRKPPKLTMFDQVPEIDTERLCIEFCNFESMAPADSVHQTLLTDHGRLTLKNFDGFERWQRDGFDPAKNNHDILNWTFVDVNEEKSVRRKAWRMCYTACS
jgi:hypothetical protein